jgi:hypothetical protein
MVCLPIVSVLFASPSIEDVGPAAYRRKYLKAYVFFSLSLSVSLSIFFFFFFFFISLTLSSARRWFSLSNAAIVARAVAKAVSVAASRPESSRSES